MKQKLIATLALLAAVGIPTSALAHSVETDYSVNGSTLDFQSIYSTGEPLNSADVQIFAPNNLETPWTELTADAEGRFTFTPDASIPGNWEVVIRQDGHGDIWTVPVSTAGIEVDQIGDGPKTDVHYASSHWMMAGTSAIALVGLGMGWARYRRTA
ncbi:carboxypeptidase regulatory-like domain-containing protein [Pseudanabaena sp. FACHB-2040]|uniref:carboxypeptidase regulatory-like domain-containing protein n=1 Tax=Pseudanabaena sp. FACHB-2040 TaxID=2692859 RepID=UPI00168A3F3F|nr:carboxypeptidase regulatory-like domain-containing protein [Pseudanabaena sp. FACHB-2040]MBD2260415.1 carboxypeptidase regulatory-like domain-containing protein [Pseudanabaena sp. FACHB-2040]